MVSTMPKDQSQGMGTWVRAAGVCPSGYQKGGGRKGSVPHHRGSLLSQSSSRWLAGEIKALFGYDFDRTSWPICEGRTVVPQSLALIITYLRPY